MIRIFSSVATDDYRLNKNTDELHKQGCIYYNTLSNYIEIANCSYKTEALSIAREIKSNADGCKICLPELHNH